MVDWLMITAVVMMVVWQCLATAKRFVEMSRSSKDESEPILWEEQIKIARSLKLEQLTALNELTSELLTHKDALYQWCENKVIALVTINGILLATMVFAFQAALERSTAIPFILIASFFLLTISLLISLYHSIPKMNAGIGNETNPRTVIGTSALTKRQFFESLTKLEVPEIVVHNINQIKGMNHIIMSNQSGIRLAVFTAAGGLILLFISTIRTVL